MQTAHSSIPTVSLNDGTLIPALGFGTLAIQPDRKSTPANSATTADIVGQALRAGYRHIDTAQAYGTEAGVGRAIAESGIPRDQLYVTSKLANANHGPDEVRRSFEATLADLSLDQLDLFLIHWPLPTLYGGDYVSTWKALTEFVADGRLRSAGVSNFQPAHLDRIIGETGTAPAVNQFELHPYFANHVAREATTRYGIAVEAHSPLGHNREPLTDAMITRIADAHGKSAAQVILRWHMQHGVIAIPKSASPQRMTENVNVFDFELSGEEMAAIDGLDRGADGRVGPNPDTYEGV
ncbi:aldo/keto reductase [Mycolicibacterium sphagni]|uniref:aldo/keto reductase n=1 Tax=Mycolicibacterium sphagni TaxID=1786 RepID=UPI0021F383BD|nr:aldo/keto reductase [Mycolicibacterium sphagni]MCV7178169.1 aldo/keto reductase [Mycolicibacterium sphagni]